MSNIMRRSSSHAPAWQSRLQAAVDRSDRKQASSKQCHLLVDCSGSMEGDKLQQARQGSWGFAERALAQGFAVGLIAFASNAARLIRPQSTLPPLKEATMRLAAAGTTDLAAALRLATQELGPVRGDRVICVVTDGMPDNQADALEAATAAKDRQISIMVIGTDDADHAFLAKLATRDALARKAERAQLARSITEMTRLLPKTR